MPICRGKTFKYEKASILSYAAVVGKTENDGPYGGEFDEVLEDNKDSAETWEQAEALLQSKALKHAMGA